MIKILMLLVSLNAIAAKDLQTYKFGNMIVAFEKVDKFTVNRSCVKSGCEALKKAREFDGKYVSSDLLVGGKNPSAVKCKTMMEGKIIIGTDRKGNEQSFCYFKDESFLRN